MEKTDDCEESFKKFYETIRQYHENTKIILLTSPDYEGNKKYALIDIAITKTYENAINKNENTILITQKKIIKDLIKDTSSKKYDKIMKKIAKSICDCHKRF